MKPLHWGVLPDQLSCQADVSHHEGNRERPRARRLQLVSCQTSRAIFAALDDHVDVLRSSESRSLFAVGRTWCAKALQGWSPPVK